MTKDEAMKLALEALEESLGYVEEEAENAQRLYGQYPTRQARIQGLKDDVRKHMKAITALREAKAEQPARPYRQLQDNGSKYFGESWDKAEQPAPVQEPVEAVAWQQGYDQGVADERISEANIGIAGFGAKVNPARNNPYTSPQTAQQEPVLQNIEQYRLQMAGISTAAIGYWKEGDGIHPDYDTVALRDVAKLYAKYDELYRAQRTWVGLTDEEIARVVSLAGFAPDWVEAHIAIQIVRVLEAKLKEKNK